jgi:hypothetical protein
MIFGIFRENNDLIWSSYEAEILDTRFMERLKKKNGACSSRSQHLILGSIGGTH